jgi:hypothetical protein
MVLLCFPLYLHDLTGHVSTQNTQMWSDENPHDIQQAPLESVKEGVWYAGQQIMAPTFFHQTMNSDQCMRNTMNPFSNQLTADEDSMGISCKIMLQQLLLTIEKSAKDSGLPDLLISINVIFISGET